MNNDDYKEALFYAASIFNERLGAEFSEDNLVLRCFQTENQQEVFEQFCKQYFPDRLEDRYTEDGYFDFHASAFVGTGDGADGILLRTDIARHPAELKHILLHELAHIFCTRNEIDGDNFFERYCMDDTISREEDGVMSKRYARQLHSADGLIAAVEQYGFLPFFRNEIHGFSIEELCPPELWFADDVDGPWEWKGPAARSGKCLYGKLFNKKAGFVSREWIPDFANFRRDGYDFDARWDDGLASYKDKEIYEAITSEGRMLSKRLKEALNYRKGGNIGFETCITRLQMQSYVCIADFVYMQDRYGRPYGWGVAEYATPEELFGYDFITSGYQRDPQESKERMMQHLSSILPGVSAQQLTKILKG